MTGARIALVATVSAVVLGLSASASAAGTSTRSGTVTSGSAGATSATRCLAHVVGGDSYDYYTAGCTGHDEPELDPVSSAPGSAQNITWRVALPADGLVLHPGPDLLRLVQLRRLARPAADPDFQRHLR